jgi:hypothetical protein
MDVDVAFTSVSGTTIVGTILLENVVTDLLPSGLPTVLPLVSQWQVARFGNLNPLTAITSSCSPPPPDKTLGDCEQCSSGSSGTPSPGAAIAAEPITLSTGNVFEMKNDYMTAGQNPLYFTRYYNSMASANGSFSGTLGPNWRTPF